MTIIAWKDGVMAADTMTSTPYGIRTGFGRKIVCGTNPEKGTFVLGFSGEVARLDSVVRWAAGVVGSDLPPSGYTALVAYSVGTLLLAEDGNAGHIDPNQPRAAGAGAELAYGALHTGASAVDAVAMCIERCIYCGGSVEFATLDSNEVKTHG
ncbi:hypothetical protein AD929_15695 [Gluconobacter potus]|uniref:Proteasome subunit beta n=1 Tax=Gluconobacter potus TaxID=2724927 RepID=A0A149QPL2_9PROT|nr:hypothetical protein [Gluconobacter potus]KXU99238.1 hypothetical protein AD929_15695 [Gluconobacter potus]